MALGGRVCRCPDVKVRLCWTACSRAQVVVGLGDIGRVDKARKQVPYLTLTGSCVLSDRHFGGGVFAGETFIYDRY